MLVVMPLFQFFGFGFEMLVLDVGAEQVEQVDDTFAMLGADRDRIAEAERIGFEPSGFARAAFGFPIRAASPP